MYVYVPLTGRTLNKKTVQDELISLLHRFPFLIIPFKNETELNLELIFLKMLKLDLQPQ